MMQELLSRFAFCRDVLHQHHSLWRESLLKGYPQSLANYPAAWLAAVAALNEAGQRQLFAAAGEGTPTLPADLAELIKSCREIAVFPRCDLSSWVLAKDELTGIKPKKKHEIERVLAVIQKMMAPHGALHAIDVGGGMGHLARILAARLGLAVTVVDSNRHLNERGNKLALSHDKGAKKGGAAGKVDFMHYKLGRFHHERAGGLASLFIPDALIIGLHTCGPLALHQFEWCQALGVKQLLNVGCCYQYLDPIHEVNLSQPAALKPLPYTDSSLALATHIVSGMGPERFYFDRRVHLYRFALQCLITSVLGCPPPSGVGYIKKRQYEVSFGEYAIDRLRYLQISHSLTAAGCDAFYHSTPLQQEIEKMFAATLIRWLLARPVEISILLDRALWLSEKGYEVKVEEIFDSALSPRNLAISARRAPL
jgi:hypothetical protein